MQFEAFKEVFKRLVNGGEAQDEREGLIADALTMANSNVKDFGTPTEAIITAWFAFMSVRRWLSGQVTPEGLASLAKLDSLLASVVASLLWESYQSLEGVDEINGQGEINAGSSDEVAGGGKGDVRAVPSPESGSPH